MQPHEYLRNSHVDRVVLYYPGSGTDSGAFRLFGENVVVSTIIYADYCTDQHTAEDFVSRIDGWTAGQIQNLSPTDFDARTWDDFWPDNRESWRFSNPSRAFGVQTYLAGPSAANLRFIFLATEALQTFSLLIRAGITPTAIVLQDHGTGCNWTTFGGASELWRTARRFNALPNILFVADNTEPWPGYERVSDYVVYGGQMHDHGRALFRLSSATASGRPRNRSRQRQKPSRSDRDCWEQRNHDTE